jgi:hypothetical protein
VLSAGVGRYTPRGSAGRAVWRAAARARGARAQGWAERAGSRDVGP